MKRVLILVEGQTEEKFIKDTVSPFLENYGIYIVPKILTTKKCKASSNYRGGMIGYEKIRKEVFNLLGDTGAAAVTTMFDYYGLPDSFPGIVKNDKLDNYSSVEQIEHAFSRDIDNAKFIPFIMLHEFEAFLFVSPEITADIIGKEFLNELQTIANLFDSPEEIDQGKLTHPSSRIIKIYPGYKKILQGSIVTKTLGISAIRSGCPHFSQWLSRLESLAG